ncbi:DUF4935 domain-containing protein [Candidatus Roizmanbacteria bacterium]|nr:DUF4935 domain-containing protein [Candidatus Roizmanbacteria bacterium]
MRHVPTSIYIDTEFFHRQGFRFDTSVFIDFRNTFAKGGLRLLVPVIMERELFRHFQKEAEKAAEGVIKAHKTHPINSLSLIDLPGKNELKSRCIAEMTRQWLSFKEHFVVENLPIVGCLEDVVDWYFDIKPPFADKNGKQKEFPDAFIISVLDQYHHKSYANIAVIGRDEDFIQACASRRYISHFIDFKDYIDEFRPELSGKDRLPEDIDLTKPITTEDLTELKAILSHGGTVTSLEIQRVMQLLERRGANYDYFFQHANDQIWLSHLSDHGYFLNPPNVELRSDGHYNFPWWPPLEYLNLAYDAAPDAVLSVIAKIPSTNNFRVLEGIAKIVLKNDSVEVFLKFSKILLLFIENCAWGADRLILDLLSKKFLFHESLNETTPVLLLKIVEFRPDKEEEKKRSRRKESSDPWETLLYPIPRFDQWEYQQILEHGFRPLADKEPYQVARILIDATSSMIRMSTHQDVIDKGSNEDFSEIWCRRLDKPDRDYRDSKEILLQTLTYTCKKVFEKVPQSIDVLDQTLRNQRWKIFSRLRQHLYALYPNEQTLLWIRDFILDHEDYSKYDHHYEFQLMIRRACEHFGQRFLSETERKTIFDAILSGPSKDEFQEWMGDRYNEEAYLQRQRYFHRKQLRPFAALLNGAYLSYYDELEKGKQTETISDESYSPIAETSVGWVSSQSPKSVDALGKLTDDELLTYLNDWDEEHRDSNNRFVEINISSLASVFQLLFKDKIVSDGERLAFWKQHRDNIERPIYIAAMCKAMQELVKDKHFDQLDQWIDFCDWILSHSEQDRKNDQPEPTEESREHPDWGTARRAVVDILDACLSMEVNAPISHREGFIVLLQMLCTQFDWRLDRDRPVLRQQCSV